MEILNKVKSWAGALADVGLSVAALAIVIEVLGLGNMPFMPEGMSVVDNVTCGGFLPLHLLMQNKNLFAAFVSV